MVAYPDVVRREEAVVYALRDVFGCEKKGQLITEFVGLLTKEGWMPIGFLSCRWLFL